MGAEESDGAAGAPGTAPEGGRFPLGEAPERAASGLPGGLTLPALSVAIVKLCYRKLRMKECMRLQDGLQKVGDGAVWYTAD